MYQAKNVTVAGTTSGNGWGAVLVANKVQPFANTETSGINITSVVSAEPIRLVIENYIPGTDITTGITFNSNSMQTPMTVTQSDCTQSVYLAK